MSKGIDTILEYRLFGGWSSWITGLFPRKNALARAEKADAAAPKGPAPAPAMLMASRDIGPLVDRAAARLADWQDRRASRRQLLGLDDRELKDIGIARCDAEREYRKPFWRA